MTFLAAGAFVVGAAFGFAFAMARVGYILAKIARDEEDVL